jgi:hypothetical protein
MAPIKANVLTTSGTKRITIPEKILDDLNWRNSNVSTFLFGLTQEDVDALPPEAKLTGPTEKTLLLLKDDSPRKGRDPFTRKITKISGNSNTWGINIPKELVSRLGTAPALYFVSGRDTFHKTDAVFACTSEQEAAWLLEPEPEKFDYNPNDRLAKEAAAMAGLPLFTHCYQVQMENKYRPKKLLAANKIAKELRDEALRRRLDIHEKGINLLSSVKESPEDFVGFSNDAERKEFFERREQSRLSTIEHHRKQIDEINKQLQEPFVILVHPAHKQGFSINQAKPSEPGGAAMGSACPTNQRPPQPSS